MSSATNKKRGGLEEEFRLRLQDAEASPSADLWARIDHSLTVQENGQYKRGMLFYRHLAAACVTLLMLAGGFAAYYFGGEPAGPVSGLNPQHENIAAVTPAEEVAPAEDVTTEQSVAAAMQEAVQSLEPKPALPRATQQSMAAAHEATPERIESIAAVKETSSKSIAAAEAATADPGAWHSLPAGTYTAAVASATGEGRSSISITSMRSRFESINRVFTERSTGGTGLLAGAKPASTEANRTPDSDFRTLNEAVMSRMKQLKEEQENALQLYKQETKALAAAGVATPSDQESKASGRWSLGMAYAPSYFEQNIGMPSQMMGPVTSFSSLAPPSAMQYSARLMDEAREEQEEEMEPGFSFGIEIKAGRKLGKKWKLLSGLGFTQNTSRSKSSYVIQQFWRKPGTMQAESPGATKVFVPSLSSNYASDSLSLTKTDGFSVIYRYRHLTVPVGLQYEGNLGKDWFWFGGAGVAANILLQTSILASSAEVSDIDYGLGDESSPFRKLQWSGNVTAGVGKRLSNSVSIAIGPEYRAYFDTMLSSPEKAQAPQGKPYTIGINMALNYDLGSGRR